MEIRGAKAADAGEIFTLQRAAFVDEAWLYGTPEVPSLRETFAECQHRLSASETFVAVDDGRIIGAVSLRSYRDGGPDIERLMVAPDRRHAGVATALVQAVEDLARRHGETHVQLIVGAIATQNRTLYARLGYADTDEFSPEEYPDVRLVSMSRPVGAQTEGQ